MVSKVADKSKRTSAETFAELRPGVSHSGCGEELSRWNGIYGRQTEKDRWKETIEDDY